MIADLQHHLQTGEGDLGAKMSELRRAIDDLKAQQRRLIELRQIDLVDQDVLESQLAPATNLSDEKESALRVPEEQQRQKDDAAEAGRRIAQFCQPVRETVDDLDFDGQRATLAAFGVHVEATRGEVSITISVDPSVTTIERTLGWICTRRPCRPWAAMHRDRSEHTPHTAPSNWKACNR